MPQVNPQLHESLSTVNGKPSAYTLSQQGGNVNTQYSLGPVGQQPTSAGKLHIKGEDVRMGPILGISSSSYKKMLAEADAQEPIGYHLD